MRGGSEKAVTRLDEGERMAFGIPKGETRRAGLVFGDGAGVDSVGEEEFAHLREVWSVERAFGEEVVGSAAGDLLELDALAAVDRVAGIGDAEASGGGGVEAENLGVEGAGSVRIRGAEAECGEAGAG